MRRFSFAFFASFGSSLAVALVAACSSSSTSTSTPDASHATDGGHAGQAEGSTAEEEFCCGYVGLCMESHGPATQAAGGWTCPGGGSPAAGCSRVCMSGPRDGGSDAATCEGYPAECCGQLDGCFQDCGPGVCTGGVYTCPNGGSNDGTCAGLCTGIRDGAVDRAEGKDAALDASPTAFACGDLTCDSATQFCRIVEGGFPQLDGSDVHPECQAIPAACTATVTCACIEKQVSPAPTCFCNEGAVTVTQEY